MMANSGQPIIFDFHWHTIIPSENKAVQVKTVGPFPAKRGAVIQSAIADLRIHLFELKAKGKNNAMSR